MRILLKIARALIGVIVGLSLLGLLVYESSFAAESMQICARPQHHPGFSTPFVRVNAWWTNGFELNRQFDTQDFDVMQHYLVMEWNPYDYAFFVCEITERPSLMTREYTDLRGRHWQIKNDWEGCQLKHW